MKLFLHKKPPTTNISKKCHQSVNYWGHESSSLCPLPQSLCLWLTQFKATVLSTHCTFTLKSGSLLYRCCIYALSSALSFTTTQCACMHACRAADLCRVSDEMWTTVSQLHQSYALCWSSTYARLVLNQATVSSRLHAK